MGASPFSMWKVNDAVVEKLRFSSVWISIPFISSVFALSQYLCTASGRRTELFDPTSALSPRTEILGITENGIGFFVRGALDTYPFSMRKVNDAEVENLRFSSD